MEGMPFSVPLSIVGQSVRSLFMRQLTGASRRQGLPWLPEAYMLSLRHTLELLEELGPQQMRELLRWVTPPLTAELARRHDSLGGVDLDWYLPPGAPERRQGAILYLHGGGYVLGSSRTHGDLIAHLALQAGRPVAAINYRLAPEHGIDEAQDDVLRAFDALRDQGLAAEQITIAGDSAGGGLALSSCVALRDRGGPMPAALGLISPWVDMRCQSGTYASNAWSDSLTPDFLRHCARLALRGESPEDPRHSPLLDDLRGLPPTLIVLGQAEILRDEGLQLVRTLEDAGVGCGLTIWPQLFHDFPLMAAVWPPAQMALAELGGFLGAAIDRATFELAYASTEEE